MADAVRRDTGALNIIETSFILLNASDLLFRVVNIGAYRMLYHLMVSMLERRRTATDLTGVKQRVAIPCVNGELSYPQDTKWA